MVQEEDITLVNIYAPYIKAPKYIKKILGDFKKEIESNTVIVGEFNALLSTMDISSKQKIIKNIAGLNDTLRGVQPFGISGPHWKKEELSWASH